MRFTLRKEYFGGLIHDAKGMACHTLSPSEYDLLQKIVENKTGEGVPVVTVNGNARAVERFKQLGLLEEAPGIPDNVQAVDTRSIVPPETIPGHCLTAPIRIYHTYSRACNLNCSQCCSRSSLFDPKLEQRMTGGEPTIRPDFLEILDYAIAKGFYVSLATSGVWDEALTQEVCRRKIDDVIVSLDGPAEINDRFRLGGSYVQTLNTILALKNAGIRKVRINTVLSRSNWRHLEPLVALCEEHDLLLIDFIHPRPFGRGESQRSSMLSSEETYQFNVLVKGWREKYPGVNIIMDFDLLANKEPMRHPIVPRIHSCPAGREFAFISPQGYMFPCGVSPVHDISQMTEQDKQFFIAGNLRQTPLLEIWRRSPVWTAFRDLRQCKPQKCFQCSFWGKKCFGTCPIGAYYESGRLNGEDPYCYVNCLPEVHS